MYFFLHKVCGFIPNNSFGLVITRRKFLTDILADPDYKTKNAMEDIREIFRVVDAEKAISFCTYSKALFYIIPAPFKVENAIGFKYTVSDKKSPHWLFREGGAVSHLLIINTSCFCMN